MNNIKHKIATMLSSLIKCMYLMSLTLLYKTTVLSTNCTALQNTVTIAASFLIEGEEHVRQPKPDENGETIVSLLNQ